MTDILFPPFLTIALTGTPGTGKTELSKKLEEDGYHVLHITEFIKKYNLPSERDDERDCEVVDMDALEEAVFEYQQQARKDFSQAFHSENLSIKDRHISPKNLPVLLIESHLAHYLCDLAVVLRTHPNVLKIRLDERGYAEKKIMENVLAESIDVVLCDCFDYCRRVYEIDTSNIKLSETAECLKELIHALYDDELEAYEMLMSQSTTENAAENSTEMNQTLADGLQSNVLDSCSEEDDGAVIYEDNDDISDFETETNPILVKYVPGKNDWSDLVE